MTDGYWSLQHVTARYRSLLLIPSFSTNATRFNFLLEATSSLYLYMNTDGI